MEKLKHQIEKTVLLSKSQIDEKLDNEEFAVGLAEIIPFDDTSLKRMKGRYKSR